MRRYALSITGLFLILYLLPLGGRPLAIPDETRYGEIPREMIASGDWVVPHLNGLPYFEKPVLGYWLNAVSISLFGKNDFAVRLASALSTGASAWLVFFLIRRFGGGAEAGFLGAAAYLTCLLVLALGIISTLDSMLTLFLTGAMVFFFFAYRETCAKKRLGFLALFGSCCGLAFLVKGFLAFAVPVITIVPFLAWERRLKDLLRIPWIPILALLFITLPWGVLIHLREADFWNYFFWTEHIKRFLSPIPGQHPKPFWYFIPILIGGALPWAALVPAAMGPIKRSAARKDPLVRFALCWFVFPFLFFSACSGKLVPYILPCIPPLVILITLGLFRYFEEGRTRSFNRCVIIMGIILGAMGLALVLNQTTPLIGIKGYGPSETWKWTAAAGGLFAWAGGTLFSAMRSDWRQQIALYAGAPLLLLFSIQFVLPDSIMEERAPERLLLRNQKRVHPGAMVVAGPHLVHAACWYYQRNDIYLIENTGELWYGLAQDHSDPPRLLTYDALRDIIQTPSRPDDIVLLLKAKHYPKTKDRLPEPRFEDRDNGFVFLVF